MTVDSNLLIPWHTFGSSLSTALLQAVAELACCDAEAESQSSHSYSWMWIWIHQHSNQGALVRFQNALMHYLGISTFSQLIHRSYYHNWITCLQGNSTPQPNRWLFGWGTRELLLPVVKKTPGPQLPSASVSVSINHSPHVSEALHTYSVSDSFWVQPFSTCKLVNSVKDIYLIIMWGKASLVPLYWYSVLIKSHNFFISTWHSFELKPVYWVSPHLVWPVAIRLEVSFGAFLCTAQVNTAFLAGVSGRERKQFPVVKPHSILEFIHQSALNTRNSPTLSEPLWKSSRTRRVV